MNKNKLSHAAFILDGNKRWARENNLPNISGYKEGLENIKKIIDYSITIKLSHLTLFTLSSENFNRPSINSIYEIIYNNFTDLLEDLVNNKNIKINIFGSRNNLPEKIINIFEEAEKMSSSNNLLTLNLAFNYGFKDELKQVLEKFKIKLDDIDFNQDNDIRNLFYLGSIPDPDILIRTGGYYRLSNFIMYNLTYTELFFTKTLWPNFSVDEFSEIIDKYNKIDRKYGL